MRSWLVGGALIRCGDGLVLVANRRRNQTLDWTPPGGVIDPGETLMSGLTREVREETGLVVERWHEMSYRVEVEAPDMGWTLRVEAWEAAEVSGQVNIDDPDGIVERVHHATAAEAAALLVDSPPWVQVPVNGWMEEGCLDGHLFRFRLHGAERGVATTERLA